MKIKIMETGEIRELHIYDPKTGLDWVSDMIGNYDGFTYSNPNDNSKIYRDEDGNYHCHLDNYEWWRDVLHNKQLVDDRIYELSKIHGSEAVMDAIHNAGNEDLQYRAYYINKALDEAFGDKS